MSEGAPRFSIIVPHYQGGIPHDVFCRGIAALRSQTYQDYEILAYHDGPLLDTGLAMPVPVTCTEKHVGDWGHSLRDQGIREARGEYIVHFNADNFLYPDALAEIVREIERQPRLFDDKNQPLDTNDIIIFPIIMFGLQKFRSITMQWRLPCPAMYSGDQLLKSRGLATQWQDSHPFFLILTGNPPVAQNIDCMQLVMKRELWLREGGWYDRRREADGVLYESFAEKYGYRHVGPILGEHY